MGNARQHGGIGDFISVEMQDGEHGAVGGRIEKLVRVPARGESAGLRFAIADDAGDDEAGIVEGRAVCVDKRVTQFPSLVNGARGFRGHVAGNAIWPTELAEEALDAVLVLLDVRVNFRVGAFEIRVRHNAWASVTGADDVDHVQATVADEPVQMQVEKIEAGGGAPVAEQARLDVVDRQRAFKEWVVLEINLADGEIVGGPPVGVHFRQEVRAERPLGCLVDCGMFEHGVPRTEDLRPDTSVTVITASAAAIKVTKPKGERRSLALLGMTVSFLVGKARRSASA